MEPMSLLDRIGKVLKGATAGDNTSKTQPPTSQPPPSAPPTPGTTGLFGSNEPAPPASAPTAEAGEPKTPSTKGLFGAPAAEQESATAPIETKTGNGETTRGLFGGAGIVTPPSSATQTGGPTSTEPLPPPDAKQAEILPVHPKVLMIVIDPKVPSEGNKSLR